MKKLLIGLMLVIACFAANPSIQSTVVSGNQVTISGQSFPASPTVLLAGNSLAINSSSTTQIVATLPPLSAGAYDLEIDPGPAHFSVVINPNATPTILTGFCDGQIPNDYAGYLGALIVLGNQPYNLICSLYGAPSSSTLVGLPITTPGVIKNLSVNTDFQFPWGFPNNTNIELDFKVVVNNTVTPIGCSVIAVGPTPPYELGPFKCSDLTNSVNINTGDLLSIVVSTPTAPIPRFNSGGNWVWPNIIASVEKQ